MDLARDVLRSGAWLTRERIQLVALAILFVSIVGLSYLLVTAHGVVDMQGRPLGTDFSSFYAAGTYVLDGNPEAPFDLARQHGSGSLARALDALCAREGADAQVCDPLH